MRYRVNNQWPVHGGSAIIYGGTLVDDAQSDYLRGVVPPPDVTPLDQETRDWLVQIYLGHPNPILPVESK